MWQSLLLKLVMFAATIGVVFWIGWSLPTALDHEHDLAAESLEGSKTITPSGRGDMASVNPSPLASLMDQTSTIPSSKLPHHGLLDLNRATSQDFDALPGVGPKLAERILKYRQSVGIFHSLDELRRVNGIGKKKFERIRSLVTVTSDAGILDRQKKAT
jgi:competence protein ComEA